MKNLVLSLSLLVSVSSLAAVHETTVQDLEATIFSDKQPYNTRWNSAMRLIDTHNPRVEPDLIALVSNKEWYLRNAALLGLQKINPPKAYEVAKKLIRDRALVVRSAALDVMKNNLENDDRKILWTELNQKYNFHGAQSLWIRHDIADLLSARPIPREHTLFQAMLNDRDEDIQYRGAVALDKLSGLYVSHEELSRKDLVSMWKRQAGIVSK